MNSNLTSKQQHIILIGLLIAYALMLTYKINEPFMRSRDEFSGTFGIAAWNWLIHGPVELKLGMKTFMMSTVLPVEATRVFFYDHPSLFIAPTAFIYWLFGVGEWQTRAGPIIFSLFSLILFWKLIARVFKTPWLTVTSSFFYAFFPMSVYFGSLLTNDYFALFFILALFLAVITFEQERQKKYLFAICAITFLGGISDWQFLFAAAAAWWYIALAKNYPQKKLLLPLIMGILAASLSLYLLQIWSITQMNPIALLSAVFWNRNVSFVNAYFHPIPLLRAFNTRLNFDIFGFSEIGLILALAGAISYFKDNKKDKAKMLFLILLASPGLLTYSIFYGHSITHQYEGIYIMPVIALMAGYGITRLRNALYASAIFLLFIASCFWYSSILFSYTEFAPDDSMLFKRANAILPISAGICLNYPNTAFYLTPSRKVDTPPCSDYSYFLLRQPQSYGKIYPLFSLDQTFQEDDFWQNVRRINFPEALGVEIIKSIPPFKRKIDNILAGHGPHNERIRSPKFAQAFINERKLQSIDCSTNFCLYKIKE